MSEHHERRAGVLLPAFSPRRREDLGIGDTLGLMQWIEWAQAHGVGFLQLLPINEMGADFSPYNAISSVALEPMYLTLSPDRVPGLSAAMLADAQSNSDRGDSVDYPAVKQRKQQLLQAAFAQWPASASDQHQQSFSVFCETEADWLEDYTLFRLLMARQNDDERWDHWPTAWRSADGARAWYAAELAHHSALAREREFFAWVQWLCHEQWLELRAHGDRCGVQLMGDIPIGVSYHSVDVLFEPQGFDLNWSGGAPRETMFKHDRFIQRWGQNWGVPLYRWDAMEQDGDAWWRRRIGKHTQIFHRFRIDHVLGFYRMYAFPWRPTQNNLFVDLDETAAAALCDGRLPQWAWRDDSTPENRAANRADGDRRLRMVLEAAGNATVVAEDLGCVPDYVRPHLESLGIAGFRIPHWDSDAGHVVRGERFPECSFATFATHDHDTIAAMWQGFHDALRHADSDVDAQQSATWNLQMLSEFAGINHTPENEFPAFSTDLLWTLIDALMACRSRDAAVMVTDIFGMTRRFNRPGTVDEENWRLRLPFCIEEIATEAFLHDSCARLRDCLLTRQRSTLIASAARDHRAEFSSSHHQH